ncbi:MAG: putative protein phosphatase 1 regulatory subunit 42 [Streblomastix strix]|uniref:Uncharacterized protein n=1 Tax=Streblomastix strix TaxID=222440 RepID=A0A5J4U759_9EUKA|nr:MAG: putative protein phosphatase 1 regulatory subunit 42 [Streblomastix strix]
MVMEKYESIDDFLDRIVQVTMNEKRITSLDGLYMCPSLEVILARGNRIRSMSKLNLKNLTHLDLQHNFIERLDGLDMLPHLTHLYLNNNCISEIVSLNGPMMLIELHLACQTSGEIRSSNASLHASQPLNTINLQITSEILMPVARSLMVLNIASIGCRDLSPLACLYRLRQLDASDNLVDSLQSIEVMLNGCINLTILKLEGNPISKQTKFFESVMTMSDSLVQINGKEVLDSQRDFCKRLKQRKNEAEASGGSLRPARLPKEPDAKSRSLLPTISSLPPDAPNKSLVLGSIPVNSQKQQQVGVPQHLRAGAGAGIRRAGSYNNVQTEKSANVADKERRDQVQGQLFGLSVAPVKVEKKAPKT